MLKLTCLVGIIMPHFSMALANSPGSTVPFEFKSKYLKARIRRTSSVVVPPDFCPSFLISSFSKLKETN